MTEEEGEKSWDSPLDAGVDDVFVSSTHEHIGTPFILIVQATDDTEKYTAFIVIQKVYKGSHEEHSRMRVYRQGMKFDRSLPDKVKCHKLFEVEDQINPILQIYDERAERRGNNFGGLVDG